MCARSVYAVGFFFYGRDTADTLFFGVCCHFVVSISVFVLGLENSSFEGLIKTLKSLVWFSLFAPNRFYQDTEREIVPR